MNVYRGRSSSLLVTPVFAIVLGCHDDTPYPDPAAVVWEGEHLAYAEEPGVAEVCAGSIPWMDRFVGAVATDLDIDHGDPLRFYRLTKDTARVACENASGRCAAGGRVYTHATVERHEPIHALRQIEYGLDERGHPFFEEGLADVYEDISGSPIMPNPAEIEAAIAVSSGTLPGEYYRTAQHFVSFLVNSHGITTTEEIVTAAADASSTDAVDRAFREVVSIPLDETVAAYLADYPVCSIYARARHPLECNDIDPVIVDPTGSGASMERQMMSCDDEDVLGTVGEKMWTYATFEIVEGGDYWIEGEDIGGNAGSLFEIVPCGGGCFEALDFWATAPESRTLELEPGRYLVRLTRAADDPAGFILRVVPL